MSRQQEGMWGSGEAKNKLFFVAYVPPDGGFILNNIVCSKLPRFGH